MSTDARTAPATASAGSPGPVRVWYEGDGRLLRLRLARPPANVLDAALVEALASALRGARDDPHLKAVLLDAEGPHFSFGASVEEHLPGAVAPMLGGFHALIRAMLTFPAAILVAVRGACLGGGLEVASAGSLLFVAEDARLGQPEIRLGVFAPAASCLLPERIGQQAAEDLLLSGRSLKAHEAVGLGLAYERCDDPGLGALRWYESHLAGTSASSLRHALRAARGGFADRVSERLTGVERAYLDELMTTKDSIEGLNAFVEKRTAQWKDA